MSLCQPSDQDWTVQIVLNVWPPAFLECSGSNLIMRSPLYFLYLSLVAHNPNSSLGASSIPLDAWEVVE